MPFWCSLGILAFSDQSLLPVVGEAEEESPSWLRREGKAKATVLMSDPTYKQGGHTKLDKQRLRNRGGGFRVKPCTVWQPWRSVCTVQCHLQVRRPGGSEVLLTLMWSQQSLGDLARMQVMIQ